MYSNNIRWWLGPTRLRKWITMSGYIEINGHGENVYTKRNKEGTFVNISVHISYNNGSIVH